MGHINICLKVTVDISIYINVTATVTKYKKKVFLRHLSDIIKMRYSNININLMATVDTLYR